jgi:hypothetical protein
MNLFKKIEEVTFFFNLPENVEDKNIRTLLLRLLGIFSKFPLSIDKTLYSSMIDFKSSLEIS